MRMLVLLLALAVPAAAMASPTDDPAYERANARLARATPAYPGARILVEEQIGGAVGAAPFEAVQRISFLGRPRTQRAAMRFYARRLGRSWRRERGACFISGSRLVVVLVYAPRRRLGVLADSRGARRCYALVGQLGDLLGVGYPDATPA